MFVGIPSTERWNEETGTEGNFTVNLTQEGRYKPRITIRTQNDLLYSSGEYALSLDVKTDENQKDPVGAQPVDLAKEFVKALIEDDRATIEKYLRGSKQRLDFIYKNEQVRLMAVERATYIDPNSWQQVYHSSGGATVTAKIHDPQLGVFDIGFELSTLDSYGQSQGQFWFIRIFY